MEQLSRLDSTNLGLFTKCQLLFVYLLQKSFDFLDEYLRVLVKTLFRRSDIYCYYIAHEEGVVDDRDALFNEVLQTLNEASTIKIAVGEMGHQLMEHPKFVAGLQNAVERNGASIEIVHGPNVDPQTRSIFQLAKEGIVTLYQSCRYDRHHFVLVEKADGSWSVLDERRRNETLWYTNEAGHHSELIQGSGRFYYMMKRSVGRAHRLKQEFETRKRTAVPVVDHPNISLPQDIASFESFVIFILSIPFKMILQPWAVYLDAAFDVILWQRRDCEDLVSTETADSLTMPPCTKPPRELPKEAQQWLVQQIVAVEPSAANHHVDAESSRSTNGVENMSALRVQAQTSARLFRDMHFMRYPESSIASLNIDDDLFLDLIWNKIFRVGELEEQLEKGSALAFRYADKGIATKEKNLAILAEAIQEWHKELVM